MSLAAAATLHTGLDLAGKSHLGVFWAKGAAQTGTLFERWNTYSRVKGERLAGKFPFGWGLTHHPDTGSTNYTSTSMRTRHRHHRFDGDIGKHAYLKDDVINAAYLVQPAADVAVVGVGGGRDILSGSALRRQPDSGIEINPAIFEVLTEIRRFLRPSRTPARRILGERRSAKLYQPLDGAVRLVQISLIDTWAATVCRGPDPHREPSLYRGGVG